MLAFRKDPQPPELYPAIQVFTELSQYTMQKHKSLISVTKALQNHNIVYRWGYPTKLTITCEGKSSVITSLQEGLALLCSWDILPEQNSKGSTSTSRLDTQNEWQVVSHKRKTNKHNT